MTPSPGPGFAPPGVVPPHPDDSHDVVVVACAATTLVEPGTAVAFVVIIAVGALLDAAWKHRAHRQRDVADEHAARIIVERMEEGHE